MQFSVSAGVPPEALAESILRLSTVDYVHVLLASVSLEGDDALGAIDAFLGGAVGLVPQLFTDDVRVMAAISATAPLIGATLLVHGIDTGGERTSL